VLGALIPCDSEAACEQGRGVGETPGVSIVGGGPLPRINVLAVCTGNICRSPAVERLLGGWLGAAGVQVTSAGTAAMVGSAMSEPMADLVRRAGARPEGFVARQLTEAMVAEADLVLAATVGHRAAVVRAHPPAVRTTFTVREIARLGTAVARQLPPGLAVARLRALVPLALTARHSLRPAPGELDVVDPYGCDAETYQRSFDQLYRAVHTLLDLAVG
jgi:protein-tyrosine phosphatase